MALSLKVTLADVAASLRQPERYVRRALENMYDCERQHGPVVLRIGLMGSGQVPHYRFDKHEENIILEYTVQFPVQSFNGRSHKPLVREGEEPEILRDEHWSRAGMTKDEVAQLLGRIRRGVRRA